MLYALRTSIAEKSSLAALRARPELRKATEMMLWAFAAAKGCLEGVSLPGHELGIVVGSGQGELETTKEYYRALALENAARPFLFQNSLHHSTAGMLSLALKITGPSVTVSDSFFSGESAVDMAATLLDSRQCLACVVVGTDTLVPTFDKAIRTRFPKDLERGEGAAALLVAREEGWDKLGGKADFVIESWSRGFEAGAKSKLGGYYEADGIAQLIAGRQTEGPLTQPKPDGTFSRFQLRKGT